MVVNIRDEKTVESDRVVREGPSEWLRTRLENKHLKALLTEIINLFPTQFSSHATLRTEKLLKINILVQK